MFGHYGISMTMDEAIYLARGASPLEDNFVEENPKGYTPKQKGKLFTLDENGEIKDPIADEESLERFGCVAHPEVTINRTRWGRGKRKRILESF
jgi:hypothetical protein